MRIQQQSLARERPFFVRPDATTPFNPDLQNIDLINQDVQHAMKAYRHLTGGSVGSVEDAKSFREILKRPRTAPGQLPRKNP